MTKKIFRAILVVAVIVLAASFATVIDSLYRYFSSNQTDQLENQLVFATHGVENEGVDYLKGLGSGEYRLTLVSQDGTVLFDTAANAEEMDNHSDREEIKEAFETGKGESSRLSETLTVKTVYLAKKLSDGTVLRISQSRASVFSLLMGTAQPMALVLVLSVCLAAFLAVRLSKKIVKPLNELSLDSPLENDVYEELAPMLRHIDAQNKKIEESARVLRESAREFSVITENMSEGLVLLNKQGIVVSMNSSAEKFFSTDQSCIGKDFIETERNPEMYRTVLLSEKEGYAETSVLQNGRNYLFRASRIENDGNFAGTVILLIDITDKSRAEENRREFTANVSHELKTPLQSIMGSAELMENGLVKPDDLPRFVGHIREEASRLLAMINDIIRLSQLDENKPIRKERVNLLETADAVAENLKDRAAEKNVEISVSGIPAEIAGEGQLVYEIIYNLADNAVKYNKENGKVKISVEKSGDMAEIRVEDTGIGIMPEDKERVFERFYRADKSHSKKIEGTGLGLSIVKHSVIYLGGKTELESEPGTGTVITVSLPLLSDGF